MLKILIELRYFVGPQGSTVVSCRCKAPSCLAAFNGDLEAVLRSLTEHLVSHGNEFANTRAWIRDSGSRLAPTSIQEASPSSRL